MCVSRSRKKQKKKVNHDLIVRTAKEEDVLGIVTLEQNVWEYNPASREMIESRLKVFPEGNFVAIDTMNANVIGYLCVMFTNHTHLTMPNRWNEITGNGFLTTHEKDGRSNLQGCESKQHQTTQCAQLAQQGEEDLLLAPPGAIEKALDHIFGKDEEENSVGQSQ